MGYLGTYTQRPVLDREAKVHSIDLTYRPTDKVRVDTVFITSDVEQGLGEIKKSGEAFRFRLTASPRKGRWHDMGVFLFGKELDITDMGYQISNNWPFLGSQTVSYTHLTLPTKRIV